MKLCMFSFSCVCTYTNLLLGTLMWLVSLHVGLVRTLLNPSKMLQQTVYESVNFS
ncbi:hypothetical protein K443DRAFT_395961 [Laccaria amethystina LaAM-08-1]|uniref:Uncharacterized protein n=1 Tax=Laccaria amethystina LaAM-08-1 TaxID=1095629 RepID=A0A0C9XBF0_9AGAR|nr:hypothetical protein K443DRAFT_395961 [Laccaria amethystina LaAM-08-1]